jgi:hypothetical protein
MKARSLTVARHFVVHGFEHIITGYDRCGHFAAARRTRRPIRCHARRCLLRLASLLISLGGAFYLRKLFAMLELALDRRADAAVVARGLRSNLRSLNTQQGAAHDHDPNQSQ